MDWGGAVLTGSGQSFPGRGARVSFITRLQSVSGSVVEVGWDQLGGKRFFVFFFFARPAGPVFRVR